MNIKKIIITSCLVFVLWGLFYFYHNPIILNKNSSFSPDEKTGHQENLKAEKPAEDLFSKKTEQQKPFKQWKKKEKQENPAVLEAKTKVSVDSALQDQTGAIEAQKKQELEKTNLTSDKWLGTKQDPAPFSLLEQKPGNPSLSYPDFARKLKMEGTNSLLFFVNEKGLVERIQLEKSSGHLELDNYVIRVLSQHQFLENNPGWVRHKQTFVLDGEEKEFLSLRHEENKAAEEKPETNKNLLKLNEAGFIGPNDLE